MKRILLAEDEEVLRMLVVDTLEDYDFMIDEAADGGEALGYIESNNYDLIILDYMMPVYTGLELIEKIRVLEKNEEHTKILMLSAKSQVHEQEKVLKAGADYFMAKPFSPLELSELVVGILNENN